MHAKRKNGFTLIELLVVVAIIGILAGLLTPAAIRMIRAAGRGKASTQVTMIANAVKQYRTEYGRLPGQRVQGADGTILPADIVADLTNNVRRRLFIEIQGGMLSPAGAFRDPWGRDFVISMDENGDGKVDLTATIDGTTFTTSVADQAVAVMSWGHNPFPNHNDPAEREKMRNKSRIYSWKN